MEAEEFIRRHATKVLAGGVGSSVFDMTPEATEQAQAIARRTGVLQPVVSFDITPAPATAAGVGFDVTYYATGGRSLCLREVIEQTANGWRIADIRRVRPSARR